MAGHVRRLESQLRSSIPGSQTYIAGLKVASRVRTLEWFLARVRAHVCFCCCQLILDTQKGPYLVRCCQ